MSGIGCPQVVGRDAERAALLDALDALDDRGRLIAVQGEAGIGKTRLATELQTAAGDRGVRVLSGRAVETDTPVPYRALFEALAGHFRKVDSADEVGLGAFRPALAQLVPQWRLPGEQLYRASSVELAEALLRLLSRIGDEQGCVLLLEDLHWADPDTAAVLEYVGDNIASLPVLCLVTLRTDNASAAERVVRALQSRRHADVLDLHRLDSAHVTRIAQLCLGTTALPAGVESLVRRFSDGLPFLVEELLATAVGDGFVRFGTDGWQTGTAADFVVPERFTDLVRRRLESLPADASDLVTRAAVAAPRFGVETVGVLTGLGQDAVLGALRAAESVQLVVPDPVDPSAFGFRHALTRAAIISQRLPAERVAIARRALGHLEADRPELPGELCEVAAGLAETAGDPARAAELLLLAAQRAAAVGAFSSAEPTLMRAWDYAGVATTTRAEVGCLLVEVLTHNGEVARALDLAQRLQQTTDRGDVALAVARVAVVAHRWDVAITALARARAQDDVLLLASAQAVEAHLAFESGRVGDAESLARSSLAAAERLGRHDLASESLHVLGLCSRARSDLLGAEHWFDRVVDLATRHGLWTWRLRGARDRASLDAWRALPSDRIVAARDEAIGAGALVDAAHLDNFLAWMARDRWETEVAEAAARRCASSARRFKLGSLAAMALTVEAISAAQRSDRERMEALLGEAAAADPGNPDAYALSSGARVNLWLRRDDLVRASAELEVMAQRLRDAATPAPERGLRVLLHALDGHDATEAISELDASPGATHALNLAYRHYALAVSAGRAGDVQAAAAHLAKAEENPLLEWVRHHARRLIAAAAMADGWGDPLGWLREGEAYFDARGHDQLAATCRRMLSEAGAPRQRRPRVDESVPADLRRAGVTAREVEVLDQLGAARSTKDIASTLFISPKTVERHVANLTAKLGVDGRSALVAFAAARSAHLDGGPDRPEWGRSR